MDPPSSEGKFDSVINQINQENDILGTVERDATLVLAKKNLDTGVQACPSVREVFTYKLLHGCAEKISNTLNVVLEHNRSRKPRFRRPESEEKVFKDVIEIRALDENNLEVTATFADYEILADTIKTLDINREEAWKDVFATIIAGYHLKKADEYLRKAREQFPEVKIDFPDEYLRRAGEQLRGVKIDLPIDDSSPKDIPSLGWFIGK